MLDEILMKPNLFLLFFFRGVHSNGHGRYFNGYSNWIKISINHRWDETRKILHKFQFRSSLNISWIIDELMAYNRRQCLSYFSDYEANVNIRLSFEWWKANISRWFEITSKSNRFRADNEIKTRHVWASCWYSRHEEIKPAFAITFHSSCRKKDF